jgi:hypothetical protein
MHIHISVSYVRYHTCAVDLYVVYFATYVSNDRVCNYVSLSLPLSVYKKNIYIYNIINIYVLKNSDVS